MINVIRGDALSEASVMSIVQSIAVNKNMSDFERLLLIDLVMDEFTVQGNYCDTCNRYNTKANMERKKV